MNTTRGVWTAAVVVIATGHCDVPFVPPLAAGLPRDVSRIVPTRYRNPAQLPCGGVLVVGASATGVRLAGRVAGVEGSRVVLADDLAATLAAADARLARLLRRIDSHAERSRPALASPPVSIAPICAPRAPTAIDLRAEGIRTVVWATGYRRSYPWLRIPVLDRRGEIVHQGGVTPEPGLYVLGLQFLRHRNSSFLDGVGRDALALAAHLTEYLERRQPRAA